MAAQVEIKNESPVPVTLGSENITITGSVNVGSTVEITNDTGNPIPILGSENDGATAIGKGVVVAGVTSGGIVQFLETNASGHLNIADGGGSITIDATSLPLPTDAATQTTLNLLNTKFINQAVHADSSTIAATTCVRAIPMNFNGTNLDRNYNNIEATLLASSARTTTQTSADIVNYNGSALIVVLDMTNVGTGSVTVSIEGKDSASGKYYNILSGSAITTNSTNRYRVGRDLLAVANSVAQDYLPRIFRIVVTANNANSATYSVGYVLTSN